MKLPPNQALKLTRLSVDFCGGSAFAHGAVMRRPYPSPAAQLSAGVGLLLAPRW
jgi:hypothetical protein